MIKKYVRKNELVGEETDEGMVLVDTDNGLIYNLNETASEIWKILKVPVSLDEIKRKLGQKYEDVDKTEIEKLLLCMKDSSFINES